MLEGKVLVVCASDFDLDLFEKHGHWTRVALLDRWLKHEFLYIFSTDRNAVVCRLAVKEWKQPCKGCRVYEPIITSREDMADLAIWPMDIEARANEAICGDPDRMSILACWEPTEHSADLLDSAGPDGRVSEAAVVRCIAERAKAHLELRMASEEQMRLDWNCLRETGCIPSVLEGVDLDALYEFHAKHGYWTLQGLKRAVPNDQTTWVNI